MVFVQQHQLGRSFTQINLLKSVSVVVLVVVLPFIIVKEIFH
jgi:hypothetical protein